MSNDNQAPPKFDIIIPRLQQCVYHHKKLYSEKPTHYRLKQIKRHEQMLSHWQSEKIKHDEQR